MGTTTMQRRKALDNANVVRLARVEIIRQLEAGERDPVGLILEPPEALAGMFVFDFLRQVRGVGMANIRDLNKLAVKEQINLAVSLGELTLYRRHWLAEALVRRRRAARRDQVLAGRPQG